MIEIRKFTEEELLETPVLNEEVNNRLLSLLDEVVDTETTQDRLREIYQLGDASIKISVLQSLRCPKNLYELAPKDGNPAVVAMSRMFGERR